MESYIHCTSILLFGLFAHMQLIIWDVKGEQLESEGRIKQFIVYFVFMLFYSMAVPDNLLLFVKNNDYDFSEEKKTLVVCFCLSSLIIIFGGPLNRIANLWENTTQDIACLQRLQDGYLRMRSFALSHMKEWSLFHLALFLISFGCQSTLDGTVLTLYTIYDNYIAQTMTLSAIDDYLDNRMNQIYKAFETKLCDKYFKIPDGLEPGIEYEIHNIEMSGFRILQFSIDTENIPEFGHKARRKFTLFNGHIALRGDWIPLPIALAG